MLAVDHLRIVITEGPAMVMRPAFYTDVGLSIWKADIVVVKNFFPFLMFFLPYNRKTLFVRTRGATDFDAAFQLAFDGPMHPRDAVDDWRDRAIGCGAASLHRRPRQARWRRRGRPRWRGLTAIAAAQQARDPRCEPIVPQVARRSQLAKPAARATSVG